MASSLLFAAAMLLQSALGAKATPQEAVSVPPIASEQVLAIPQELREQFTHKVLETKSPEQRLYRLVDFMLKPDGLGLKYSPNATNTVSESYFSRQVNCMAFTMMAVALAREAGLQAYAQQIDKVMAWEMSGDVVTQSLHANAVVIVGSRKYMLDIAVGRLAQPVVDYKIDDEHLLALFYGNRALEFLAAGDLESAVSWQEEALRHDRFDATLWNNGGILRQRLGDSAGAEKMYLKAVELSPGLTSALANLEALSRQLGELARAEFWRRQSARILRNDPYYQFARGRIDEEAGNYASAVDFYRRAISLYGQEHVFHFYLARVYVKMGRVRDADRELKVAQQMSEGASHQLYAAKLNALHRMTN
jgi:tetratricopeptide (TPR) repeat protein